MLICTYFLKLFVTTETKVGASSKFIYRLGAVVQKLPGEWWLQHCNMRSPKTKSTHPFPRGCSKLIHGRRSQWLPVLIFAVKTELGSLSAALCACHSASVLFINSNELPMLLYSIVQLYLPRFLMSEFGKFALNWHGRNFSYMEWTPVRQM